MTTGFSFIRRDIKRLLHQLESSDLVSRVRGDAYDSDSVLGKLDQQSKTHLQTIAEKEGLDIPQIAGALLSEALVQHQALDERTQLWSLLTKREQEVAALACQEKTNAEIGLQLYISEETVKKHMSSILRKFDLRGREILSWMLKDWGFANLEKPWEDVT